MSERQNCWEIMGCGREPGGAMAATRGVCAAAAAAHADGLNRGVNGGRICWAVTGTYSGSVAHGSFAARRLSCMNCEVFNRVREEEGLKGFTLLLPGQLLRARKVG